jgi:hypothetical protein
MEHWICQTCGVQFAASEQPPDTCPICSDERQYIGPNGQQWTTLAQMRQQGYQSKYVEHEPGLIGVGATPSFAIGQRALLLRHPEGNILWDCLTYFDDTTVAEIERLGGVSALAISHPHYYSTMVEWADRFDMPIYLHEADRQWLMRPDDRITFWSGETRPLKDGVTLIHLGGHFAGGLALGARRGGQGRAAQRRHHSGGVRSPLGQLHVQLPQPDPAARRRGCAHPRHGQPVEVRAYLRRLVRPHHA